MTRVLIDLGKMWWFKWVVAGMMAFNIGTALLGIWWLVDLRGDRIADRVRADIVRSDVAAWMAEPLFADDVILEITLGTDQHTTTVLERTKSGGPRTIMTQQTPGTWYTQIWQGDRVICRSPLRGANPADYGPVSPLEIEHSWAFYTDDEDGHCFGKLTPCEAFELRAIRELTRTIDGAPYPRLAPPQVGTVAVPCDWRGP